MRLDGQILQWFYIFYFPRYKKSAKKHGNTKSSHRRIFYGFVNDLLLDGGLIAEDGQGSKVNGRNIASLRQSSLP
jgi:hypothetical protein